MRILTSTFHEPLVYTRLKPFSLNTSHFLKARIQDTLCLLNVQLLKPFEKKEEDFSCHVSQDQGSMKLLMILLAL